MSEFERRENVFTGIIGAFLFSLVGGVLWYVLYQIGYLAGISAIVGVVCAIKGYSFFAKVESKKGVIISAIIALAVIVIAWYFCLSNDLYVACQEWYAVGEIDYCPTFFECVRSAYQFLEEPEVADAYFKDLGIGMVLGILGCAGSVITAFKKAGAPKTEVEPQVIPQPTAEEENV